MHENEPVFPFIPSNALVVVTPPGGAIILTGVHSGPVNVFVDPRTGPPGEGPIQAGKKSRKSPCRPLRETLSSPVLIKILIPTRSPLSRAAVPAPTGPLPYPTAKTRPPAPRPPLSAPTTPGASCCLKERRGTYEATPGLTTDLHLKQSRAAATRYDKRGYVFLGTAMAAARAIWLPGPDHHSSSRTRSRRSPRTNAPRCPLPSRRCARWPWPSSLSAPHPVADSRVRRPAT
jgi:hypothetical protein